MSDISHWTAESVTIYIGMYRRQLPTCYTCLQGSHWNKAKYFKPSSCMALLLADISDTASRRFVFAAFLTNHDQPLTKV